MPAESAEVQSRRVEVPGGWVRLRPMNIDDLLAFSEAENNLPGAIRAVKAAAVEFEFENGLPLGQQKIEVLNVLLREWNKSEDDAALPPANGQSSA